MLADICTHVYYTLYTYSPVVIIMDMMDYVAMYIITYKIQIKEQYSDDMKLRGIANFEVLKGLISKSWSIMGSILVLNNAWLLLGAWQPHAT